MKLLARLAIATVVSFAASASVNAQSPVQGDLAGQTLSPGDQLRIAVWKEPDMSCDCLVAGNGTVIHPLYREIAVVGVPMNVVEERFRTFLSKYKQVPQFVIQPLVKIVVRGEVRTPNIYSVPPETTIAQAIVLAGGATDRGRLDEIKVIRDRQEIKLDIGRPDSESALLQIRSNDQIVVGRKRQSPLQYIGPVASTISVAVGLITLFTR